MHNFVIVVAKFFSFVYSDIAFFLALGAGSLLMMVSLSCVQSPAQNFWKRLLSRALSVVVYVLPPLSWAGLFRSN